MKSEKQLDTIRHFSVFSVSFSLPLHFNAIGSQSPETHDRDWTRKDLSHNGPSRTFWPPPWLFVQFLATRIMGNTIKAQIWQKRVLRNYINMTNFNVTIKFDSYLYTILYYSYATLDREYCSGLSWKIYYKYIYIYISFIKFTKILISATLNAVKITAIYGYQISLFWSGKTKTSLQIYKGILESF